MRTKLLKLLSLGLALTVLLLALPTVAFAEEGVGVFVSSEQELIAAVENGGDITLSLPITLNAPLSVTKDTTIHAENYPIYAGTMDLESFFIVSGATLTVTGSSRWSNIISYTGPGSAYIMRNSVPIPATPIPVYPRASS